MQAVIQAGGKGTRVSSLTGDRIPKPMLEVEDYPVLYHQIMNLKRYGIDDIVIITGYLGNIIEDYFKDGKEFGVNINYVRENPNEPLGTAGSLYFLKDYIKGDYIFLLADVFTNINYKKMIDFHRSNNAGITLFTHPNAHPFDSDIIACDNNNVVTGIDYKTNDRSSYYYCNNVNAGVMIFSRDTLDLIKEPKKYNYEKDIVLPYITNGKVVSYKSPEYVKDMGTPERYLKVIEDYKSGYIEQRNLENKQKCVFLDRDGTINKYEGLLKHPEEFELLSGVCEAIKMINESGYLAIVVTNQPIIARGESSSDNLNNIHRKMETLLGKEGAFLDALYYCPHHPDKGYEGEVPELKIECECRKPKTGMIDKAVENFNIDLENSYMVGDSTIDIECGRRAGVKTVLVKTGVSGKDNKYQVEPDYSCDDLLDFANNTLGKTKDKSMKFINK